MKDLGLERGAAKRQAKGPVDLSPFRLAERQREANPAVVLGGTDKDDLRGACLAGAEGACRGQAGASQIGFGPICERRQGEGASWH